MRKYLTSPMTALALISGLQLGMVACSTSTTTPTTNPTPSVAPVTLSVAKMWVDDVAPAVMAAAQVYLAGPPAPSPAQAAQINSAIADLQTAQAAFDKLQPSDDPKATTTQVLTLLNNLLPIASPHMPNGTALYASLGISVIQAFVNALPPPPDAPATPPASLHAAAAKFHPKH